MNITDTIGLKLAYAGGILGHVILESTLDNGGSIPNFRMTVLFFGLFFIGLLLASWWVGKYKVVKTSSPPKRLIVPTSK